MNHLIKQPLTLLLALLLPGIGHLSAEQVEFRASAPSQVIVGHPFQLTYSVNQPSKDLRAPDFVDFDYLAGPYTSQSSSTSFVNGKRTSSFNITYTYTLKATTAGTFTIQPATIRSGSETYTSNGLRIIVLPEDQQSAAPSSGSAAASNAPASSGNTGSVSSSSSGSDIFMRTIVSKTRVHEQEVIALSYKLYFAGVDVAQFTNNTKLPEFKGFLKQDVEQGEIQTELEHYNGRNYQTATIYRTLLFPQHSGDIPISPAQFEAIIRVRNRSQVRSIFDDFFDTYSNVTKPLTAPGITIHVDALPSGKPSEFSGGVGTFTMTDDISSTSLNANEAVTLRITIRGAGNMKLLKTPSVDWPEGFEVYDPKVENDFKTTSSGVTGTKTIEYLAIPRAAGEYTIPAVHFSYFDTQSGAYKTISTQDYTLHIARIGADDEPAAPVVNNYVNKENIRQLGTDIRYIFTGPQPAAKRATPALLTFGSTSMWLAYILPLLLAIVLFILFRHQIRENADRARVRYKQANKVAQRRLKRAKSLLADDHKAEFYEEIERAAWTYLSDRLSIPTSELNKQNIADILAAKQVDESIINNVIRVLETAQFARYAPAPGHAMTDLYNDTAKLIDQLEEQKL